MKDFNKIEEAVKLLRESGVDYVLANKTEDECGFCANASLTPIDLANAIKTMVKAIAVQAKEAGVLEEVLGLKFVGAVILGVKEGYGTLNKDEL